MTRLGVMHEYDDLKEAIVGIPDDIQIPVLIGEMRDELETLTRQSAEFWLCGQGRMLADYAPEVDDGLKEQVDLLVTTLKNRGVTIHRPRRLTQSEGAFPGVGARGDALLFMRDPLLVVQDYIIELAMRFPFRRRRKFAIREIIEKRASENDGRLIAMPEPIPVAVEEGCGPSAFLEGGDVLLDGERVFVGLSGHASSPAGVNWLQRLLGTDIQVEPVPIAHGIVHLDCVLCLVRPGLALACLEALPAGLPTTLRDWEVVQVTLDEARRLACNGLVLDRKTMIVDKTHPRIAEELDKRGVEIIAIPYDLPARFGGGLRCSYHPLIRDSGCASSTPADARRRGCSAGTSGLVRTR